MQLLVKTVKRGSIKRSVLFFCMISAAGLLPGAPRQTGGRDDAATGTLEGKLYQMEHDWAAALMKNDASTIERIEAADYSYVMDSILGDKEANLADAKNAALSGSADLSELKARVFGDTAIVTGKAALRSATYKGKDISGNYLFTDIFVKRNGRWQAVASHSNKLPGM